MSRIFSCLFIEHDLRYVAAAVLVLAMGATLTIRLFSRVTRRRGLEKGIWLFLAGFIGGSTTWATHFLAMLGYTTGGIAGYEPGGTLASLAVSIGGVTAGLAISAYGGRSMLLEAGGVVLGLGLGAMHYLGMSAYEVQGEIVWRLDYVAMSLLAGAFFSAVAMNRAARPVTRFCRYGAVAALIVAIASVHFIGMAAIDLVPDTTLEVPQSVISSAVLGLGVLGLMMVLLALAAASYLIDASTMREAVERYRQLSLQDPLTGLPNRSAFQEELSEASVHAVGLGARVAILSFDLDRFKEVNDVHGHLAGDAVLRTIGDRLASVISDGEFVARIGGDEFIAMTRRYYGRADASRLAARMIAEIVKPIEWNGNSLNVGTSVGVAILDDDVEVEDLLAQADVAMYRAKETGSNAVCFYDASMDRAVRERNVLAMDMRSGLLRGEFQLNYQRQNDTFTGAVVGFEALLRWNHPYRGNVPPSEFIPIAERSGFIVELGEWVLREACREAASWRNPLSIAVNVATQQLADPRFPGVVQDILQETGLNPARLELEITETGIIADHQRALQTIRHLKSLGAKIAMDDYGTGYSSLSMLLAFPFDKIKIDRQFVDGVATSAQSAAIVRSTLILASSLEIPVLAEGVETDEHVNFLRDEGCVQVQGYFYGKPVPRTEIEAIVNAVVDRRPDQAKVA
ncbi:MULTISPECIES: putative bifunctional diguanylate cyclase/phosphodiesterase [Pseudorhizobium]|uniref:Diguanylate cyclase (GGDEF)-like protein n=2 Tax=Pseudorhizobium TaxID=1903858 RepID=A0A7W9YUG0_9HYPH|nr:MULTISPECIES: EAL domain-containing protein [Pseudorhizobium]MBB6178492.1 diguanylate cyclase (GGDEF)-like protein [Pseudorhizobium flavum]CAD6611101.1 bifunctional diguanylate cyclase/phosphodiesterase [Pseudorhizobium flavum]CAD7038942.1 bifunctional diguanylate cyclase/phosphodiesterase [Pseudorhizobium halotolerans]